MILTTPLTACIEDPEASPDCTAGASRAADDGCNTCQCTDDGAWACTDLACPAPACGGDAGAACEAVFDSCECAWRCGPSGAGAPVDCDQECPAVEIPAPDCGCVDGVCTAGPAPPCEPGAARPAEDGCNTCTCTDAGEWACTERACPEPICDDDAGCAAVYDTCNCLWTCLPPGEVPMECAGVEPCPAADPDAAPQCACQEGQCVSRPAVECEPGDTLEADNGQSCTCTDAGRWLCLCADPEPEGRCLCTPEGEWRCMGAGECEPGAERPSDDGCNTCTCTAEGAWACTDRACPEPICDDDAGCAAVYDECNCAWRCERPGFVPEDCAGLVACEPPDPDAAPECACQDGQCVTRGRPECAPGDTMEAENGQSCRCDDAGAWACLCPTPAPEGQCLCTPEGEWMCRAERECAPGEAFEAENGQSCECTENGTWSCLCPEPQPAGDCLCQAGAWACGDPAPPG